jgi:hypothetical protein
MQPIKIEQPWRHWLVDDFLTPACLCELKNIEHRVEQNVPGRRVDSVRLFVNQSNRDRYPELYALYANLQDGQYREFFEQATGQSYQGLFPRVEVISDIGQFYLEPHCDLKDKRLTALVYTDYSRLYPGTQLGNNYTVPARDNRCFFFNPGDDTWHGYPLTDFATVRRCLQINYWTYEVSDIPVY